jgi:hypothetical protein
MTTISEALTIQIKSEYVFKLKLKSSVGGAAVPGLLVHAVSGSFVANLYSGTDGIIAFRAKNKNFDEAASFTIDVTDSSGAFVNQLATVIPIAGSNQYYYTELAVRPYYQLTITLTDNTIATLKPAQNVSVKITFGGIDLTETTNALGSVYFRASSTMDFSATNTVAYVATDPSQEY